VPGVSADGGVDVLVASYWESIPLYEAWRNNSAAITAHLPSGTYQYVPKKGEGFPGTACRGIWRVAEIRARRGCWYIT
jgi:hypothetical protein